MQFAKETALEAHAVAQMQASISQRGAMLMYAAEYSNVKVLRLMRRVVFKCWCAFVKYGGSASCVAIVLQCTTSLARALCVPLSESTSSKWMALLRTESVADSVTAASVCCVAVSYLCREEEFKRVMMARRLLSQSVLGGVFGRWIAFTEQCYVRATRRSRAGAKALLQ